MFLKMNRSQVSYTASGEQRSGGLYLLLACSDEKVGDYKELRGLVRSTRLRQCGHFMMGEMVIDGLRIGLSGPLGSDGLPKNQDDVPWDQMVPVDAETARAYWTDTTGHNDVGVSGKDLRQWADENMDRLLQAGRKKKKRGGLLKP
jgi:hypothetical protein